MSLPKDSKARKAVPLFRGCMSYFPDALAAIAELSHKGNEKHNPGETLRWSREKSSDHADCIARHLIDSGPDHTAVDPEDNVLHAVKVAWRSCALAQIAIEQSREKCKPDKRPPDYSVGSIVRQHPKVAGIIKEMRSYGGTTSE